MMQSLKKLVRRAWTLWCRLPRPFRGLLNVVLVVILLLYATMFIYAQHTVSHTAAEQRFRQEELRNQVGPSEIIGQMETGNEMYPHAMWGDAGEGIVFYCYNDSFTQKVFTYTEKTGDVTIAVMPVDSFKFSGGNMLPVRIFAFDTYPEAVRAVLGITIDNGMYNPTDSPYYHSYTYRVEATREDAGYFVLPLEAKSASGSLEWSSENQIVVDFMKAVALDNLPYRTHYLEYDAILCLYDAHGNQLLRRKIILRNPSAEFYLQNNGWIP